MKALILVDLQNDFLPGGALAVADGDQVIPVANRLQEKFSIVYATKDWHPADHGSFAVNHPGKSVGDIIDLNGLPQILWPAHCVQNTPGSEFSPQLDVRRVKKVFLKGTDPAIDSYSALFDNGRQRSTGLPEELKAQGITEAYFMGLATDYCVRFSAADAVTLGLQTYVIQDGCRAVNLAPGDEQRALQGLADQGVKVIHSDDVVSA